MKEKDKYYLFIWGHKYRRVIGQFNTIENVQAYINENKLNGKKFTLIKGTEIPVKKGFIIDES